MRFTSLGRSLSIAAALTAALLGACNKPPAYHGIVIDPPREVGSFSFRREDARIFSTDARKGKIQLVFFGYTNCPDVCPIILADWARVRKQLGSDTARVQFLFVTVDPQRDTPIIAQQYASQFDSAFVGLSGDSATTVNIQKAFAVASQKSTAPTEAGYLVGHSSQSFIVNDQGKIVLSYGYGSEWKGILEDIQTVLR